MRIILTLLSICGLVLGQNSFQAPALSPGTSVKDGIEIMFQRPESPECCLTAARRTQVSWVGSPTCNISEPIDPPTDFPPSCTARRSSGTRCSHGRCRKRQWYYRGSRKNCYAFTYKGCGGNGNRFNSKKECLKKCKPPGPCANLPKVKRSNRGSCARKRLHYWSHTRGRCFVTRGCGLNSNKFKSKFHCEKKCMGVSPCKKSLPKVKRTRRGRCRRKYFYYYNHRRNKCLRTRGCSRNANNFKTRKACKSHCKL